MMHRSALFPDSSEQFSRVESRPTLFQNVLASDVNASEALAHHLGGLAQEVASRGGVINIVGDGPEQGITVSLNGQTVRLIPTDGLGPDEERSIGEIKHKIGFGRIDDPFEMHLAALRVYIGIESQLRGNQ